MKGVVSSLCLPVLLASCVTQGERMTRPDGSTYTYFYGQVGGAATSTSSTGTTVTADLQKSFQDFLAMVGVSVAAWSQTAIAKAKEISAQYQAGQLTKQQAQSQMHALQMAELASKERMALTPVTTSTPLP
ncbi:hypothetical protein [Verrucomicrobium spinosum]|uniref:hypothetical protein n=1 Tax=Verrucomicrobium spinosum TaxID=2736 RepID=UPI0001745BF6|nr:hypothetical protein [Verrucomicrobium spinosum]